jgi:hypothetical protein
MPYAQLVHSVYELNLAIKLNRCYLSVLIQDATEPENLVTQKKSWVMPK